MQSRSSDFIILRDIKRIAAMHPAATKPRLHRAEGHLTAESGLRVFSSRVRVEGHLMAESGLTGM